MLESRKDNGNIEAEEYTRWKDDHDDEPKRPYRLWDAREKHDMQYRYYSNKRNALNAALIESAWSKVGCSIEVYDCRNASHLATFTRRTTGEISRWLSRHAD